MFFYKDHVLVPLRISWVFVFYWPPWPEFHVEDENGIDVQFRTGEHASGIDPELNSMRLSQGTDPVEWLAREFPGVRCEELSQKEGKVERHFKVVRIP